MTQPNQPDTLFVDDSHTATFSEAKDNADNLVEWTYTWAGNPADSAIRASICPVKYGKKWAYSIEIDDGTRQTGLFAPDFFATFKYTDAPPEIRGGTPMPVVGSLSVIVSPVDADCRVLTHGDLSQIQKKGWSIANHSYSHSGRTWGDLPEILSEESMVKDLFWSQTILTTWNIHGCVPVHYVYPNGYTDYANHFDETEIISASLVGGTDGRNILHPDTGKRLYLDRTFLDESVWSNTGNPLEGLPLNGFKTGDLQIDFTHAINTVPFSSNQKRWKERLRHLEQTYGAQGSDEFWSAPPDEVIRYTHAAQDSKIEVASNRFTLSLPEHRAGTSLTVKLDNVPNATRMDAPEGGVIYRQDKTVWLTTPLIGECCKKVKPAVKEIYRGAMVQNLVFSKPIKIAAVQVKVHGNPVDMALSLCLPDSSRMYFDGIAASSYYMTGYQLFSQYPNHDAITATGIHVDVEHNYCYREMVVWTLEE
ncbi:hypothetical protein FACS189430_00450 [Bacteroidia bacterium]|nr:hypothetical protein FACS189430_00450 [Bacteroidia bacterium]